MTERTWGRRGEVKLDTLLQRPSVTPSGFPDFVNDEFMALARARATRSVSTPPTRSKQQASNPDRFPGT